MIRRITLISKYLLIVVKAVGGTMETLQGPKGQIVGCKGLQAVWAVARHQRHLQSCSLNAISTISKISNLNVLSIIKLIQIPNYKWY